MRKIPAPRRETPQPLLADGSLPPTLGPVFVAWAETYLVHGEGDLLGQPYKVPAAGVRAAYRILEYDPTQLVQVGPITAYRYIVSRALIIMPKGSAKTELIAALMLFLLAGPSLPTPAGPVMRRSPNIPVAAGSWEQANKLFGNAATNMAKGTTDSPAMLAPFVECFDSEILLKHQPGRLYRVAAVAATNDGELPTAGAADEIHEWTGRKARVHLVLFQGLEKRANGLELNITTPDDANPDSLLGQMVAYAEKVASGEIDDPSFYFLHYGTAPDRPLTDDTGAIDRQLLVEALDDATPAEWADIEARADSLIRKNIPIHELRRYWLGAFVRGAGHWLPEGAWEARRHPKGLKQPKKGTPVVLAFDGSYRRDSTALVGCTLKGHVFVVKVWERPDKAGPRWKVPRGEVKDTVAAAMRRWDVVELAPDPPGWADEIEQWEAAYGEVVVEFPTNQTAHMVPACSRFYAGVAGGDEDLAALPLTHDGDPVLARHLRNAVPKPKPGGDVITKEATDSPRKIDTALAAVVAYDRACWHANNVPASETVNLW
ncbi:MAG TPA: terminase large subunit [Aquihabitans sp.]|nr:terminase large subunit [Aquihabitans sp.]